MLPFSSLWPYTPIRPRPETTQHVKEKPLRPGDSLPKAYINTTQATLVKTINTYENEINALDKDIGKLSEERRQAQIAVDGMRAALEHMNGAEDRHETKVDQLTETALVETLETL